MKDIKSYVIGFLTCACLFLIMGQTKSDSQIGRYQITGDKTTYLMMIDTSTGALSHWQPLTKKWEKRSKDGKIFH